MIPNPRPEVEDKLLKPFTWQPNQYLFIGDLILIYPAFNAAPDSQRILCSKCHEGFCYMRNEQVPYYVVSGWLCSQCERLIQIKYCIGKGRGEKDIGVHDYENLIGTKYHVYDIHKKGMDDHKEVKQCRKCRITVTMEEELKRFFEYFANDFKIPLKLVKVDNLFYGNYMLELDFGSLNKSQIDEYTSILLRWLNPDPKPDQIKDEFQIEFWRGYYKDWNEGKNQVWYMYAVCF